MCIEGVTKKKKIQYVCFLARKCVLFEAVIKFFGSAVLDGFLRFSNFAANVLKERR